MRKFSLLLICLSLMCGHAWAKPATLLVLGDSLTEGYGLAPEQAFPVRLEAALQAKFPGTRIVNGGVSGDTAADGLARLGWALADDVAGILVELGANDALRGLPVAQTEAALDAILAGAKAKGLPVLLLGMKAPPNLGPDYVAAFDAIYPRLSAKYQVPLYGFFLEGVAADRTLNQDDGIHPNAKGVDIIVKKLLPDVEKMLTK